jgi:hypothetical protein
LLPAGYSYAPGLGGRYPPPIRDRRSQKFLNVVPPGAPEAVQRHAVTTVTATLAGATDSTYRYDDAGNTITRPGRTGDHDRRGVAIPGRRERSRYSTTGPCRPAELSGVNGIATAAGRWRWI